LFSHFMQQDFAPAHRGIFLAGDDISWTAGWAEGAITTAVNAACGVIRHLGGQSTDANPDPIDAWPQLQPHQLDP
jgi:tryptophan 2-monooxygenase